MAKQKNPLVINAEAPLDDPEHANAKKKPAESTENSESTESTESTLTNNEEEAESTGTYAELTFNLDMVRVRHELLEGRNYTVCPMVMITEGVHNGSNGPLYYPPEELRKTPAVWNHKPVVVYHPTHNGQGISACEPAVISRRKVGLIMNTRYIPGKGKTPGKLTAEAWLETERLPAVDDRVALAVKNRQQMEVSTGLFTDNELKEGLWRKEPYTAIARNYRPDHLAILPDEKGSCSLADGAGLMRNAEVSHGEIRDRLHNALRTRPTFPTGLKSENPHDVPWVRDVFKTFCIYTSGNDTYKHDYEVGKAGEVKLKGNPQKVASRQTYSTEDGKIINSQGVQAMDKDQLIEALIDNAESPFTEADRATLNAFDEDTLDVLFNKVGCGDTVTGPEGPNAKQIKGAKKFVKPKKQGSKSGVETKNAAPEDGDEEEETTTKNSEATVDEYINAAPPEVREYLQQGMSTLNAEKAKLIDTIVNNSAGVRMNKQALAGRSFDDLRTMAALAAGPQRQAQQRPQSLLMNNYAGMGDAGGFTAPADGGISEEPSLVCPTLNFSRNS